MRPILLTALLAAILAGGCSQSCPTDLDEAMRQQLLAGPQLAAAGAAPRVRTDTPAADSTWLALGGELARADGEHGPAAGEDAAGAASLTDRPIERSWKRRGPAYPGDVLHSIGRDAKELLPMVWDDTKATATNPLSLALLGAAGVTGIALSGDCANDQVQRHYERNGHQLPKCLDQVGDIGGNPGTHFAVAGAMYLTSLLREDDQTYEVAQSLTSALAINGLATMALKAAARTENPNGGEFGWPSGHTSSTFTFAAVLNEHYGPWVGVPLYAFATFVGYQRVDARSHDFADVISGALIGIAIGHAVAGNHQPQILGMDVLPYADPRGGAGIALMKQW